jgi:hypothetical protein
MNLIHSVKKTYGVRQLAGRLISSLDRTGYDIHRLTTPDLNLVMADFRRKRANISRNLERGKITFCRALARTIA